jgi:hypothetical protein
VNVCVNQNSYPCLAATALENGWHEIRGDGIAGRIYRIEYAETPNGPDWQQLGSAVANEVGVFVFLDTAGSAVR